MIELIFNKSRWNKVIDSLPNADTYHTFEYHQIARQENETPVLLNYESAGVHIALPLLLRQIEGTEYRDVTSVYGYIGPVSQNVSPEFNNRDFAYALKKILFEHNIVSVFSRLNPFIPCQGIILKGMGNITASGDVVNIDLTQELGMQRKQYQKRLVTYINKARRECDIVQGVVEADIKQFITLYNKNMKRVKAKKHYFFKDSYFFDLLSSKEFETELLLAVEKITGTIIAGAIFLKKNQTVQYHLSGANDDYLKLNPIKLLIDEMRLRATKEGYTYFNLGGGVGTLSGSLFHFKSKFSKDHKAFNLWKYVVNETVYNQLINELQSRVEPDMIKDCDEFFPLYRCHLLQELSL